MMDRAFLDDLFSAFGLVVLRRMFSGFAVSADDVTFALVLRGALHFRVDDANRPRFEAEGSRPFAYDKRGRTVTIASYWQLPERLYDDPDELAEWAGEALAAARRAAAAKARRGGKRKVARSAKTASTPAARATTKKKRAVPEKKTATRAVRRPARGRARKTRGRPRR